MDFLVHTVKLKPIIKDQIPGKLVTYGISDVATTFSTLRENLGEEVDYDNYYYKKQKTIY